MEFFSETFFLFLLSSDSRPLCCTTYLLFSPASSPGHFTTQFLSFVPFKTLPSHGANTVVI